MLASLKRCSIWISALLLLVVILFTAPIRGNAAEELSEGLFTYTVTSGKATITGSVSTLSGQVTVPSAIGGYPVTAIGSQAFYNCDGITSVVIGECVTEIGDRAFYSCGEMTDITLPDSLTKIGQSAFYYCSGLTEIVIPEGVTTIYSYAFECCSGLVNVSIPNSITTVGTGVFSSCSKLQYNTYEQCKYLGNPSNAFLVLAAPVSRTVTTVKINADTVSIAGEAFYNCSKLVDLVIPDRVETVGSSAFANCISLSNVTVGKAVTTIGTEAFYRCSSLQSIVIPDSVVSIGGSAFEECSALSEITLGSGLAQINYSAFARTGIEQVVIPGSVQTLGNGVFRSCNALRAVEISHGLKTIAYQMFSGCSNLQEINIPESVVSISQEAFSGCESLQSVELPDSVTDVGQKAFSGCTNLQSVRISRNLTTIQDYTFSGCVNLHTLIISDTIGVIYNRSFYNCNIKKLVVDDGSTSLTGAMLVSASTLEQIVIPDSVTEIYAGAISACQNLQSIQVGKNASYCSGPNGELLNKDRTELLFVPKKLAGSYCIPDGVTTIGPAAFYNCAMLTEITVSEHLTSVGSDAFYGCGIKKLIVADGAATVSSSMVLSKATLEEIVIPNSVTSFGKNAFSQCENLKSIEISQYVTSIGENAFEDCKSLTDIVIPSSVQKLGEACFRGCTGLVSLELPFVQTVSTGVNNRVWKYPFGYYFGTAGRDGCMEVKQTVYKTPSGAYAPSSETVTYYIPESLRSVTVTGKTVQSEVFAYCQMLKEINLPNVQTIGDDAFYGCTNLAVVRLSDDLATVGNYAFDACSSLQYYVYDNAKYIGSANNPYLLLLDTVSASITSCAIHPATKLIENRAFNGCSLQRLIYPEGFVQIRKELVVPQTSLKEVVIAKSVKTIDSGAFYQCSYLADIYYTGTQAQWQTVTIGSSNDPLQKATMHYNSCFVTYKDWDGTVLAEKIMQLGDTLVLEPAPAKPADNTYTYIFAGWDPATCTGDMEVTAVYTPKYIDYTVSFLNWDGSALQSGTFHYGDGVSAPAKPVRPYDATYYYVFAGWDSAVSSVCDGSKTYTAVYETRERTKAATPSAPVAEQVSQTKVVLKAAEGYAYSMDGVTWQDSNVFSGLKADTQYTFYQMVKETETIVASQVSPVLKLKTPAKTACAEKAAIPIVADYTYDKVVLLARSGYEYRMNNGAWTTDPEFTGLQSNTAYVFEQRIAESGEAYASAVSEAVTFTTAGKPNGVTSASNYEKLRQYVLANGSGGILKKTGYYGSERRYYQLSAKNSDGIVFSVEMTSTAATRTEISAQFTLYPDERYVTVSVIVGVFDNDTIRDTAQAFIRVDRATYRTSVRLTTTEAGMSEITSGDMSDYATTAMTELCGYWDLFLYYDSGMEIGLRSLGFVDFSGSAPDACDLPSGHHAGAAELRNQRQPGCSFDGYTGDQYCADCGGKIASGEAIPSDGKHSFTDYVSNGDATCTADGTKTAKCDWCEETDTAVEEKLGHSFTNYISNNDATCAADGTKTAKCDRCDETDTAVEEKLGHSFTNYISNNDATYEADGTKTAKCDRCLVTETVTDPGSKLEAPRNGWYQDGAGKWYFYENNKMVTNAWRKDSKGWCFLGADGAMLTNQWKRDSKGWCYIDGSGYIVYNKWVKDSVGWCYVDGSGYMVYNKWVKDSVGWCHVGANGYMEYNKWIKDSKGWCYVDGSGYMVYNKWVRDSVGWCHVGSSGYMEYNKWIKDSMGWCHVGSSGYMEYNKWIKDSKGWCFVDSSGYMVTDSWERDSSGWNYINSSGYLSSHKLDYHNHSFVPATVSSRETCSCGAQRGKKKPQDPNCWYGTEVKTVMAVTGVTGVASYTSWTDLKPVSESYVAGCQRYSIDFEKEYTPYAVEEYEKYFAPYIAYLKGLGLKCTSEPAVALGGIGEETYQFVVGDKIMSVSWNISQYSNYSWMLIMFL